MWAGYYNLKRKYVSDDIDMPNEVNETFVGFMLASLTVRGSIIIMAFAGFTCFAFSFFAPNAVSIIVGLLLGLLASVVATFILRRPVVHEADCEDRERDGDERERTADGVLRELHEVEVRLLEELEHPERRLAVRVDAVV